MSMEIQVDPAAVQSLVEKARQVPSERMNAAIDKLSDLQEVTSDWKGDAVESHEAARNELENVLTNSKALMDAILSTLDQAVEDFSSKDEEISMKFEKKVDNYSSK
ncbi:WXG100 family type VII secretion target [Alkalicoccobacillus murimartini]|uniref:Uncharacterized protein YukE n=1 Tax=Alkalicoccobacillus murimartini TaxID=171685 RepID=A0ABT9YGY2_9BACI|nr:WXG100 family type VII secretion target [Alkalicoccobacillus murimartini]MDQ0206951.1 uncharacterized protein YukE [Alkalicoccobacillus murimartini]